MSEANAVTATANDLDNAAAIIERGLRLEHRGGYIWVARIWYEGRVIGDAVGHPSIATYKALRAAADHLRLKDAESIAKQTTMTTRDAFALLKDGMSKLDIIGLHTVAMSKGMNVDASTLRKLHRQGQIPRREIYGTWTPPEES